MVAPLKQRGLDELNSLQKRARSLFSLNRISREDFDYIDTRLSEVEAKIIEMRERMPHNQKRPPF